MRSTASPCNCVADNCQKLILYTRLRGELRDSVESQLVHIEGEADHVREKVSDEQLLHTLQHQVQVATQVGSVPDFCLKVMDF